MSFISPAPIRLRISVSENIVFRSTDTHSGTTEGDGANQSHAHTQKHTYHTPSFLRRRNRPCAAPATDKFGGSNS